MSDRTLRSSLRSVRKSRLDPRVVISKLNLPNEILIQHKINNFMSIAKTGLELKATSPESRTPEQFINIVDQFLNVLEKDQIVFPHFMINKQKKINVAIRDVTIAVNLFKRQMIKVMGKFTSTSLLRVELERRRKTNPPFLGLDNHSVTNIISVGRSDGQNIVDIFSGNVKMRPDKNGIYSCHSPIMHHGVKIQEQRLITPRLINAQSVALSDKSVPLIDNGEGNSTPRMDLKYRILNRVRNSNFHEHSLNKSEGPELYNGGNFYVVSKVEKRVDNSFS